jgi:SpoVK/Ycf46/Vps4 family AAA+-type ATPase
MTQSYELDRLARASEGYTGAEIEQVIIDAMYLAYSDVKNPGRDFTTDDLLTALQKQVPLSRSQSEAITALRNWLTQGRAQSASFLEKQQAEAEFVQIQIINN